jgi:multisite-specific tRNA:(cytosine-C5)-methyltransferase
MRQFKDNLEIVDMNNYFNGSDIKVRPGLTNWKVMVESNEDKSKILEITSKTDKLYETYSNLVEESCFPDNEDTNSNVYRLQNCIRLFPHDSDTSGFFITVLRKTSPTNLNDKAPKNKNPIKDKEYFMIKDNQEVISWLKDYYGIDKFPFDQLVTQSTIAKKINFVSKGVQDVLESDKRNMLKLINVGVKLFSFNKLKEGQSSDHFCKYRVCQDGLMNVIPFLTKRILFCDESLFVKLLTVSDILHTDIEDEELRTALANNKSGCVIMVYVKEKPLHLDISKYDANEYLVYLKANYVDSICCYSSAVRISSQISRDHHFVYDLKYNIKRDK